MADATATRFLQSPIFVLSYPKLETAVIFKDKKTGKPKGDPKYSMEMIIDGESMSKFLVKSDDGWLKDQDLKQLCMAVAKEYWPDKKLGDLFQRNSESGQLRGWAIQDGDIKAAKMEEIKKKGDHYLGKKCVMANANQEYPPQLMWVSAGKVINLDRDDKEDMARIKKYFVGGAFCRAELTLKALNTPQGDFVKCYVNGVCFIKSGPKLSQGGSMAERFQGIIGGESDIDPTAQDEFGGDEEFAG